MRVIAEAREPNGSLWRASLNRKETYRLMRYHVRTECEESTVLLNTVTGELVILSEVEKEILDRLPLTYKPEMDELIAHRFLVPEEFDEVSSTTQLRKVIRSLSYRKNEVNSFTILPTTSCNARCFYCYESDFPRETMSVETARKVVDFISSNCGEQKSVRLHWFGGEPLLGKKIIDLITCGLKERGVAYKSRMTSNASLFTESLVGHAREQWHLYRIQITLDGTEQVYNEAKSYVGFKGNPYRTVLENIRYLLLQKVHVVVRLNLGIHNMAIMHDLIQEISALYGGYGNLTVYVGILFDDMGFEKVHHSESDLGKLESTKLELERELESAGIRTNKSLELPYLKTEHCMADNPHTLLISPNGSLGKCEHAVFDKLVGDIQSESLNEDVVQEWCKVRRWLECERCCLYPECVMLEGCEQLRPCHKIALEKRVFDVKQIMTEKYRIDNAGCL